MSAQDQLDEFSTLQALISSLSPYDNETRMRLLQTVATFFNLAPPTSAPQLVPGTSIGSSTYSNSPAGQFSDRPELSPKQFMLEKQPKSDVERVTCLAYYLTHYRATPHFKTVDISILNTEAAQPKFSNTAYAVNNATQMGYLVPSTKGLKQLGAVGEQFVQALPDREAASEALKRFRRKKVRRGKGRLSSNVRGNGEDAESDDSDIGHDEE